MAERPNARAGRLTSMTFASIRRALGLYCRRRRALGGTGYGGGGSYFMAGPTLHASSDPFWPGRRRAWLCHLLPHRRRLLVTDHEAIVYCWRCGRVLDVDERRTFPGYTRGN